MRTEMNQVMLYRFKSFLTSRRIFSKFERNLKKHRKGITFNRYIKNYEKDPYNLITIAFRWDRTDEEFSFWNRADVMWRSKCHRIEEDFKYYYNLRGVKYGTKIENKPK